MFFVIISSQPSNISLAGKFRPTEEEVAGLGPDFKAAWDRDFRDAPNRPLMIIAMYLAYFGDHSRLPDDSEYVSMANWTAYPCECHDTRWRLDQVKLILAQSREATYTSLGPILATPLTSTWDT